MGNCCCNQRDQAVSPEDPKEANTATNDTYQEQKGKQGESQEKDVKRQSGGGSTTESDTKEARNSQAINAFRELLRGLERTEELGEESQIATQTWLGTIDMVSAQFAIKVILLLQSQDFANNAMVRFAYYSTLKRADTLSVVVTNLHANKRCVRYAFAHLLEVLLSVFMNLTFSLVHDLLALSILSSLDRALLANETPEYHLCISNTLHCLYCRNLFLQVRLIEPEYRLLITHFVKLLTKFADPRMVRIHAENLSDFATRYDGCIIPENWKCLESLGLQEQIEESREKLKRWKGKNLDEIEKADLALRQLLSSGLTIPPSEAAIFPSE